MTARARLTCLALAGLLLAIDGSKGPSGNTEIFDAQVCSPPAQEALDLQSLASAREGFDSGLHTARSHGDEKAQGTCAFYIGLTTQLQAQAAQAPERQQALLEEAASWYESSLEMDRHAPGTIANLARVYVDLKDSSKADSLFRKALADAPHGARLQLLTSYADLLSRQAQWDEAVQQYRQALVVSQTGREPGAALIEQHARTALFEILLDHSPEEIANDVWDAVAAGETQSAQNAAFHALQGSLSAKSKRSLLAAVVAALARQPYTLAEFASTPAAEGLRALFGDPEIGTGARQILALHSGEFLTPDSYGWWADAKLSASHQPSRLAAFRSLVRSLALKVSASDPQVAQTYLELGDQLAPEVPDVQLYSQLAASYFAMKQPDRLKSNLERWERLLRDVSPELGSQKAQLNQPGGLPPTPDTDKVSDGAPRVDPRDLATYHLRIAQALQRLDIRAEPGSPTSVGYQLEQAGDAAERSRDLGVLLAVGAMQERNGLRDEAVETYKDARFLEKKIGSAEGGEGTVRLGSWNPSTGDCSGYPEVPCPENVGSLELPELVPLSPDRWITAQARTTVVLDCQGPRPILAGSRRLLPRVEPSASRSDRRPFPSLPAGACRRVRLDPAPAWPVSAAWEGRSSLLVADPPRAQLLRYSLDGALRQVTPLGTEEAVAKGRRGSGDELRAMYQGIPAGPGTFFTLGDLRNSDGSWTRGVVRTSLDRLQVLHRYAAHDPNLALYRLGSPFFARAGSRAYFLDLTSGSLLALPESRGTARRLMTLTKPLGNLRLTRALQTRDAAFLYRTLEEASLPAGLYGSGSLLHLLTRGPGKRVGETTWTLTRIDPVLRKARGSVRLPTSAPHLTVVPGDHHWALIERGRVQGWGRQEVQTVVFVPSSWIESGAGDLVCGEDAPTEG